MRSNTEQTTRVGPDEDQRAKIVAAKRALGSLTETIRQLVTKHETLVAEADVVAAAVNKHYAKAVECQRVLGIRNCEPLVAPGQRPGFHTQQVPLDTQPPSDPHLYDELIAVTKRETAERAARRRGGRQRRRRCAAPGCRTSRRSRRTCRSAASDGPGRGSRHCPAPPHG